MFAVAGFAASMLAAETAVAQSFFEKLFGLGDNRPPQSAAGVAVRPIATRPIAGVMDHTSGREPSRSSRLGDDDGRTGQTYQTMCVRTCDGYYWPVRYPAKRADFDQDANVCASTCGAQAKLYTRAGPGTEPEEMRDADGNSYGSSKSAFAYRKGLVNGCTCRGMPWSDAERARHEGYALAEAEKAIRLAQVEAEKTAAVAAEAERIARDKTHEQMMADVVAAEKSAGASASAEEDAGPVAGPAEAAAISRFTQGRADVAAVGEPEVPVAEDLSRGKGRKAARARAGHHGSRETVQRPRLPRGQQVPLVRPRYAASAQKVPWWAQ